MNLNGIHHVTAVTATVGRNVDFYTRVLGLRLVKKSVNQDDVSAYHLFYADKVGSPGTDMTFFDWPRAGKGRRGTDAIVATAFRVDGRAALDYWANRLTSAGISHNGVQTFAGRDILQFEDFEGQRLIFVDDQSTDYEGELWDGSEVPVEFALRGFYAVMLSVPSLAQTDALLTQLLAFEKLQEAQLPDERTAHIYQTAGGGPGRELWIVEEPSAGMSWLGAGGVHHVAFRVADKDEQAYWRERISGSGLNISPFIDRYYFQSIYFRISNGILFEIATDGPGFATDEDLDSLGETLALPPFLEDQREQIEAGLKPIEVVRP